MSLHELYQKYHDQVQFLSIYIREAHPVDGWWLGDGLIGKAMNAGYAKAALDVYDPRQSKSDGLSPDDAKRASSMASGPTWTRWTTQ